MLQDHRHEWHSVCFIWVVCNYNIKRGYTSKTQRNLACPARAGSSSTQGIQITKTATPLMFVLSHKRSWKCRKKQVKTINSQAGQDRVRKRMSDTKVIVHWNMICTRKAAKCGVLNSWHSQQHHKPDRITELWKQFNLILPQQCQITAQIHCFPLEIWHSLGNSKAVQWQVSSCCIQGQRPQISIPELQALLPLLCKNSKEKTNVAPKPKKH